ncbi:hypothetical protein BGZ46_009709 [Entomortierella lignicola]|nr:hypothetical protein BGZ46_009709 [Entomortierella lignicola]
MFCVIKATYLKESRRFTLSEIHLENLKLDASNLTYEILHEKICSLFNKTSMSIHYVNHSGDRKIITNDADILEAIADFHLQPQPNPTMLVVRLDVESCEQKKASNMSEQIVNAVAACSLDDGKAQKCGVSATGDNSNAVDSIDKIKETVHMNVYCDMCLNTIRGIRWKCQDCDNYDLCQICQPLAGLRHPFHTFKPIEKYNGETEQISGMANNNYRRQSADSLIHNASCDICLNTIEGVRHKCMQCPDYDLCQGCLPLAKASHKNHSFFPITYPSQVDIKMDRTLHSNVRCDGCDEDIYGVRYKCGNCLNYDLCGNCEALPEPIHDPNHVFLKIRKPIAPRLTHQAAPLLPNLHQNGWGKTVCFHPQQTGQPCQMATVLKTTKDISLNTNAVAPQTPESETVFARFVKDITLKDGSVVPAGAYFLKVWEMANSGLHDWPEGTELQFVGGDKMFEQSLEVKVTPANVGEYVCISANLKAPTIPGRYISYWRLVTPSGDRFGHRVWCDILVEEAPKTSVPTVSVESTPLAPEEEENEQKQEESTEMPKEDNDDGDDDFVVIDTDDDVNDV